MEILSRAIRAVKDSIFPPRCLVCRSFFHHSLPADASKSQGVYESDYVNAADDLSSFVCSSCLENLSPIEAPICSKCGKMFKTREGDDHECEDCIRSPKQFTKARAAGKYDQSLMNLIHQLKYKGKIQLARPLGQLLFSTLCHFWNTRNIDVIVPVPLHQKRFKKRGFNQAYLLIKDWPKEHTHSAPSAPGHVSTQIDRDVLIREKHTKPQTGLSRTDRVKNIKNAFRVIRSEKVKGKRVLVVDDVYTTGATTNECARVLLKHGALSVDILTLARAM